MRVPKSWVPLLARKIVSDLTTRELIEPTVTAEEVVTETERLIMGELMIEDRLNEEVREILKKFTGEIEKGRLDYRKMFDLTKKKLVEERGIVL